MGVLVFGVAMVAQKAGTVSSKSKRTPPKNEKKGKEEKSQQSTPSATPMGSMGPVAPKNPDLLCPHLSFVRLEKLKRKILTPTAWSCSGMYHVTDTLYPTVRAHIYLFFPYLFFLLLDFHHIKLFCYFFFILLHHFVLCIGYKKGLVVGLFTFANSCFEECGTTEGVWACLTCGKIGCGRYQSEHALSHYEDYQVCKSLYLNRHILHFLLLIMRAASTCP